MTSNGRCIKCDKYTPDNEPTYKLGDWNPLCLQCYAKARDQLESEIMDQSEETQAGAIRQSMSEDAFMIHGLKFKCDTCGEDFTLSPIALGLPAQCKCPGVQWMLDVGVKKVVFRG